MYGLVNKALQDFVTLNFGTAKWDAVRAKANITNLFFSGMETYPDEVTYKLAGATSEVLGVSLDAALEAFGEYWVVYTAQEGYGDMLKMCGSTLKEFMLNLDSLHARIRLSFPDLRPPILKCSDVTDQSLHLHYISHRPDLTPMVIGLIKGLGKRFDVPVDVSIIERKSDGADHDVFLVKF